MFEPEKIDIVGLGGIIPVTGYPEIINRKEGGGDHQVEYTVGPVVHCPGIHYFFRSRLHLQALGKNRGKFLSPDDTGADQYQQDDTGNDPVIAKEPEAVFLQKANKEFNRQHRDNKRYGIANGK